VLRHYDLTVFGDSHAPKTLTGNCGPDPGVACRLVWDVSHNGQAAELTNSFLAGPVHLLLRLIFVVLLALGIQILVHRVINRLTERAAQTILPFRGTGAARFTPGALVRHPVRYLRRRRRGNAETEQIAAAERIAAAESAISGAPGTAELAADMEHALVDERRHQRVRALGSILRSASSIAIFGIAGVVVLGDLGINLAPLLASAGVVGVAIGFGAQNLVRDYLSGIFMLLEDQYGVGDSITVGGASGTVETVTLRITRLRDTKGVVWHIRNGAIEQVGNQSQGWARAVIDYPVPYDGNLATIRDIIEQAAQALWHEPEWRALMLAAPEVWGAQEVSSKQVTMRVVVKTAPLRQWSVEREMRARIKAALDAAGVHFPPPSSDG
jgi:small-conductance mechanosensitive channel